MILSIDHLRNGTKMVIHFYLRVQARKWDRVLHKQLGEKDGKGDRELENGHSMTMMHKHTEIIVSQFI